MSYTAQSHITSVKDVKAFFKYLVRERNIPLQPDMVFANYLDADTQNPVFPPEECELFDRLMDEAFEVCEKLNADIYEIGINTLVP
ncbi:MAG: hypothetical protein MJZ66_01305 [Bacteroidales bacterium]|nr:hypothetical protein [Bacteroidales bacterium]